MQVPLGLDQILSGSDHLLFILGLLLLVTNLKRLLLVITGFTIGHSLTLSLSVINIIQVKSSLVEALIGYTIMFVGLEYLYKENKYLHLYFLLHKHSHLNQIQVSIHFLDHNKKFCKQIFDRSFVIVRQLIMFY